MINSTFSKLGLSDNLLQAIDDLGYEEPSKIQQMAIPLALEGKDLIGISETGSGKTAAFGLSGLSKIDTSISNTQMLVVCPTRELAVQVCSDLQNLAKYINGLHITAVYGGAPIDRQIRSLRNGVQIVVGTPGRLIDHVKRGTLKLSKVSFVTLDEADRMLDMGFIDEMEGLLRSISNDHQTLFFSATMNPSVKKLIDKFGDNPQTIKVNKEGITVSSIEQFYFEVRQRSRVEIISRLIDLEDPRLAIVFCNTKRSADECTESLISRGYSVDRLHGDIAQSMRERVLKLFREKKVEILVATDVAARGIDVDEIDLVINYELPQDPEDYVHRIGRTGRAGRKGKAASFMFGRDAYRIRTIERYIKQSIVRSEIPSQKQVDDYILNQFKIDLVNNIKDSKQEELDKNKNFLNDIIEMGYDWEKISLSLYSMLKEVNVRQGEEVLEDNPRNISSGRNNRREDKFDKSSRTRDRFKNDQDIEAGKVRLFISIGKRSGIDVGDILGMLTNQCDILSSEVGRIRLLPNFCFVDIDENVASNAILNAKKATLRGNEFDIDYERGARSGAYKGKDKKLKNRSRNSSGDFIKSRKGKDFKKGYNKRS